MGCVGAKNAPVEAFGGDQPSSLPSAATGFDGRIRRQQPQQPIAADAAAPNTHGPPPEGRGQTSRRGHEARNPLIFTANTDDGDEAPASVAGTIGAIGLGEFSVHHHLGSHADTADSSGGATGNADDTASFIVSDALAPAGAGASRSSLLSGSGSLHDSQRQRVAAILRLRTPTLASY
jgi:hypothetical protein